MMRLVCLSEVNQNNDLIVKKHNDKYIPYLSDYQHVKFMLRYETGRMSNLSFKECALNEIMLIPPSSDEMID